MIRYSVAPARFGAHDFLTRGGGLALSMHQFGVL